MNQLIKVEELKFSGEVKQTVNARNLYKFLDVKQEYSKWIKNRIETYDFIEGTDFISTHARKGDRQNVLAIDHLFTIESAKELCMVERTDKGKSARRYFIAIEKQLSERPTWIAARQEGKGVRKILTDTMKSFIEYAKSQGSESAEKYYMTFTKMVNEQLLEFDKKPTNLRDQLNASQLHRISVAEQIIIQSIVDCMSKRVHYKEVYKIAKEKIHTLAITVGKSKLGQTENQTLKLEFTA